MLVWLATGVCLPAGVSSAAPVSGLAMCATLTQGAVYVLSSLKVTGVSAVHLAPGALTP